MISVRHLALAWAIVSAAALAGRGGILVETDALVAGAGGYPVYRIPGFTVAQDGSLLLFAEGRPSQSDPGGAGDIEIVFTRSVDGGETWSPLSVLHAESGFDYSDPRVVVDRNSGDAHLQYVQWPTRSGQTSVPAGLGSNSAVIYYQRSADNGQSWSGPTNINLQVKDPNWASLNTGPGLGIQLKWQDSDPSRNGRLLIPAHHRPTAYRGVSIYSDDDGATWAHGSGSTPGFTDESEVVELVNGDLLWDGRQQGGSRRNRYISHDGGDTWPEAFQGDVPITPVDAGLARYSARREGHDRDRILFSGPLGSTLGAGNSRDNIGVWTSYDEGKTFINPIQIQDGSAAYSVIDKLPDGSIGLIYEVNHSTIRYVNFDLAELERAAHPATMSHYDGFGNAVDPFRGGVGWSGGWVNSGAAVEAGALEFDGYYTAGDEQHVRLRESTMTRQLGLGAFDLDVNQTVYASLFIKHAGADGANSGSEFLDVLLQNGAGETQAAFGVGSDENFFVNELGGVVTTPRDALKRDETYLVLVKIAAQDGSSGAHADQISMAWYDDPAEVPADESQVDWQLTGARSENSGEAIEQIKLSAGASADWLVDGLRIGSAFEAVVVDTGILLPNVLGDLNGDRIITLEDWSLFRNQMQLDTSALSSDQQRRQGDFDASGLVDLSDFTKFVELFDAAHGANAFADILAVPEPASWALLAMGSFVEAMRRRFAAAP
ncbi:MAG TPA: exo-alpha-sialidase [Lacipirellula sp.]